MNTNAQTRIRMPADADPVADFVCQLRRKFNANICGEVHQPARAGHFVSFPSQVDSRLIGALASRGIDKLYSHQQEAWGHISAGQHTVIVTPTASGKSVCFNLPVMDAILKGQKKALYLFPTKALAQDQVAEINALNKAGQLGIRAFTFDGDTPSDARRAVRTRGDIVVSNPDMLHQGVLPHHSKWAQFFESLAFVVVDEMHLYRGVFGAHVANLFSRLQRICGFYGSQPVFIFCSATIANPQQLASQLLGQDVVLVDRNGAPQGERSLLLFNPPMVNKDLAIRASARSQTTKIAKMAVSAKLKTIVFAQSRLMVEVLTKYLKDKFDQDPRRKIRVKAYRGGYLPTERRKTERALRDNQTDCVVSTSALELGVDIGSLDVCVLNGYPGSIAATWQRVGRAGRRQRSSVGVLVASSMALDQYIVQNPDFFATASPESVRIAPDQMLIRLDHIRSAAFELPFQLGDEFGGQAVDTALEYLEHQAVVHFDGQQWHWMDDSYPAASINLRSVADGNFLVIDRTDGQRNIIAEVDFSSAALTLYEGAIYMIQSAPWQVEKLDWVGRKAFVTKTDADYFTDAIDYTRLKILEKFETATLGQGNCLIGEVHLVRRVTGYKKIRYYTHENVGYGSINLPDQEMHTAAIWWTLDSETLEREFPQRWQAMDGFLGAAYVLHTVTCLRSMSDPRDIGKAVADGSADWAANLDTSGRGSLYDSSGHEVSSSTLQRFSPSIFLYDNYPGGMGITHSLFSQLTTVISDARNIVSRCQCKTGCPACIGPIVSEGRPGQETPRQLALRVLDLLL